MFILSFRGVSGVRVIIVYFIEFGRVFGIWFLEGRI